MPFRRRIATTLAAAGALAAALTAAPAGGQDGSPDVNPCNNPLLRLRCPDLRMAPPADLRVQRAGHGQVRLLATNHIVNVGQGPLELRATPTPGSTFAKA